LLQNVEKPNKLNKGTFVILIWIAIRPIKVTNCQLIPENVCLKKVLFNYDLFGF